MKKIAFPLAILALVAATTACGDPKVEYKGLKLMRPNLPPISSRDVDRFLDSMRTQMAKPTPLSAEARLGNGDRAVIDFAGTLGGTPFEGGTGVAYPLVLGSGQMIPGFEAGIIGMRPGETKNIRVKFPSDYQEAALAGKEAVFRITVREGSSLARPPLDDELARKVSGGQLSSLSELRKGVREQITQDRARQIEQQMRLSAVGELVKQWSWKPSAGAVKAEADRLVQQHIQMALQRGSKPDVASQQGESMRPSYMKSAERNLVFQRISTSIAKKEKITVTDVELEQVAQQMAKAQGQDPANVMNYLREAKMTDALRRRILEDRVLGIVLENALVEDAPIIKEPAGRRDKLPAGAR